MQQNSLLGSRGGGRIGYYHVIKFSNFVYFSEIINRNVREIVDNLKTSVLINRWYCR
jgi:hypothetical protein